MSLKFHIIIFECYNVKGPSYFIYFFCIYRKLHSDILKQVCTNYLQKICYSVGQGFCLNYLIICFLKSRYIICIGTTNLKYIKVFLPITKNI